jgi:endonuclease G
LWQEIFLERHCTNAAPQRSLLHQGKQLWQGLENYILNSAHARIQSLRRHRSVYTDEDPVLEEESVRVPLEFWKVVVMEDSERNKLRAAAYWLSQGQMIRKLPEDRDYRSGAATGYGFGALKAADRCNPRGRTGDVAATRPQLPW